jgi:ABC-2 type transport system permease protein
VAGRVCGALVVVAIQIALLAVTALILGWRFPVAGLPWVVLLIILGTLTFGALGVLLGGALRAEIVLALANIIWFVLLMVGGVALGVPVGFVHLLPSAALAQALETSVVHGTAPGVGPVAVLVAWGVVAGALATRTTRLT